MAQQSKLNEEWERRGPFDRDAGTLVVLPSLTLPIDELKDVLGIQYYEERLLFTLLLLRRPGMRLVFLSSTPVAGEIIDHYLGYLPADPPPRDRLTLIPVGDARPLPLTTKILASPATIGAMRRVAADHGDAYLLPFNVTEQEERLAALTGLPLYGSPSRLAHLGEKSSGRVVARSAGVPVVEGFEDLRGLADIEAAFTRLGAPRAVLKLNDSFSGMGNAILSDHPRPDTAEIVPGSVWALVPEGPGRWQDYLRRLAERGGVIERLLDGPLLAPSVQMLIQPTAEPEVISTHDQILGGAESQVYLGCSFPADITYRARIVAAARSVAAELATRGVIGLLAIDFLVSPAEDRVYFGEINLRLGGTTHPYGICKHLTQSTYDETTGNLVSPLGPRFYVASDNVQHDGLAGHSPAAAIKAIAAAGLLYDRARRTGITLHQMGSLPEFGKLGICSIAASPQEAKDVFENAVETLTRLGL